MPHGEPSGLNCVTFSPWFSEDRIFLADIPRDCGIGLTSPFLGFSLPPPGFRTGVEVCLPCADCCC